MSSSKFRFSKASLEKLVNTTDKTQQYYDSIQHGLCIRVSPINTKTFRLSVWDTLRKRPVQQSIGKYPYVDINTARAIVAEKLIDIAKGVDVTEKARKIREELTFEEAFNLWTKDCKEEGKKTWSDDASRYELYIKDHLGRMRLSSITPDVVRRWRGKMLKKKKMRGRGNISKTTINRAFSIISAVFNHCAKHLHNPCSEISKFKEPKRNTFLKSEELNRFFAALDSIYTPEYLKDYLLISLYTGARRSNVLAMRWEHIDLGTKLWLIPGDEMKNTQPMVVPLLDQAVKILYRRKRFSKSEFVFPSLKKSNTGHLIEPKRAWKSLLKSADLPLSYRLHDLRRTMGSWQAITGSSTKIIGASLGHKSEQATAHYAYLTIEPVRAAMQRAADAMDTHKIQPK